MSAPRWSQGKKQGKVGPPGCLVTVAQGWCRTSQAPFLEEGTDPSAHLRQEAVPGSTSGSSGGARGKRLARDEAGSRDVQAAVIGVGYPGRARQGYWASGGLGNRGGSLPQLAGQPGAKVRLGPRSSRRSLRAPRGEQAGEVGLAPTPGAGSRKSSPVGAALGAVLQVRRCRCSFRQCGRAASALEEVSAGLPSRPRNASPGARASGWARLGEGIF